MGSLPSTEFLKTPNEVALILLNDYLPAFLINQQKKAGYRISHSVLLKKRLVDFLRRGGIYFHESRYICRRYRDSYLRGVLS
jgi:hypothetical protein